MTEEELIALRGEAAVSVAAQHALWRVGNLTWLLDAGQLEARAMLLSGRARRYVLAWARRRGKTWFAVEWAFEVCLAIAGARVPYAAPTGKMVEDFVVPIAVLFANTAPRDIRPEVIAGEIRFHNGSFIPMEGCEDRKKADRLRGSTAQAGVVDEGGFIPILDYVVKDVLLPQTLTTDGILLLSSSPPTTPAHPFTTFASEAERRNAYMHLDVYSNPRLTPRQIAEYCEEAGGPRSATWLREGLALFVTDPKKAIVPEFSQQGVDGVLNEAAIVQIVPRPTHFDAYVVGDLGYVDLTVILFAYWHFELALIVVEDELVLERATSATIQQGVTTLEHQLWGPGPDGRPLARNTSRVIDAPPITRADMSSLQPDAQTAHDWDPARKVDKAAGVNALRLDVQRRVLRIHPRCRTLIAHLRHGTWNERRTDFARSEGLGHNDGVAAATYLSRAVDRNLNPFPPPSFDHHTHHVGPLAPSNATSGWASLVNRKRR